MVAKHVAQGGMHEVGRRMIQADGLPAVSIDVSLDPVADAYLPRLHRAIMDVRFARLLRVDHRERVITGREHARVANLPAALRVERRRREYDDTIIAHHELVDRLAIGEQRNDLAGFLGALVAGKRCLDVRLNAVAADRAEFARGARTITLPSHRFVKAFFVDAQAALASDVGGEVHRETISIVELEHDVAR